MNIQIVERRPVIGLHAEARITLDPKAVIFQLRTEDHSANWKVLRQCGQAEGTCPLIGQENGIDGDRVCDAVVYTKKGLERGVWCGKTGATERYINRASE